jgi:glycosyltransferase involved in cell wall biosynthesis
MSAGPSAFRPCVVIPSYNNPVTIRRVVLAVRAYVPDVIVVDDGSSEEGRAAIAALGVEGIATVHHRAANGGKGAAVKDALRLARDAGFSHALQVDADGQHTLEDIPRMLEAAQEAPTALILGQPVFDESAPKARLVGRRITIFWTRLEVGGVGHRRPDVRLPGLPAAGQRRGERVGRPHGLRP